MADFERDGPETVAAYGVVISFFLTLLAILYAEMTASITVENSRILYSAFGFICSEYRNITVGRGGNGR